MKILKMKHGEGLYRYNKKPLGLLSAMLVKNYRSDLKTDLINGDSAFDGG